MTKKNIFSWRACAALCAGLMAISQAAAPEPDARRDAAVVAVEKVINSVVNISTKTVTQRRGFFYDWWRDNWAPFVEELPPQYSAGSGVIVDEEGYVLTNAHVIEGATEIWVKMFDERLLKAEPVVGTRKSDVALLKLQGKSGEKFPAARFAPDDDLLLGETVLALGNPFGLGGSVSKGILSSKNRRATAGEHQLEMEDWIQTDAAINPGNSGGPLVNVKGEVIGLNVAIYREGQGIGFAIPAKRLSEALSEIFSPETLKSIWFGARFGVDKSGLVVSSVQERSPAASAGLKKGDLILNVNNRTPKNIIDLNRTIMDSDKNTATLTLLREKERKTVRVELAPESDFFNADLVKQKLGLTFEALPPQLEARLSAANLNGFLIASVEKGSPAAAAGLQRGMLIQSVDGQPVADITALAKALHQKKKGDTARLNVIIPNPLRRAAVDIKVR